MGLELSLDGLRKAARLAADRGVHVPWVCSAMPDVPVRGLFDLVYSCGSIHYVDAYRDWTILRHDEGLISCAQDGTLHVHSVETVVARRG